jgi:membrane-bound lytic murein transglycosylase B
VDAVPLRRAAPEGPDQTRDEQAGEALRDETSREASDEASREASGDGSAREASDEPAREAGGTGSSGDLPGGERLAPRRHRRRLAGRGAHALRRVRPPHQVAAAAARRTAEWARQPHGRVALAGLFIAALLALTGAAGAYLVPAGTPVDTVHPAAQNSAAPPDPGSPSAAASAPTAVPSAGSGLDPSAVPVPSLSQGNQVGTTGSRPADALASWAQRVASLVDIPPVALQAYGYAELVVAQTTSSCHLSWTTLAAIGAVESNHGSAKGATLYPDGQALPPIVGLPLDGKDGRQSVPDTDGGQLDNDTTWDHAVGPMQFIPSTWRSQAVDADNDGVRNPNDIDDAALAAANYLCSNGRDLATPSGWWDAIAAYNLPRSYGEAVFAKANYYGTKSQG